MLPTTQEIEIRGPYCLDFFGNFLFVRRGGLGNSDTNFVLIYDVNRSEWDRNDRLEILTLNSSALSTKVSVSQTVRPQVK